MHNNEKIIDQQHQKTILSNGLTVLSFTKEDVSSIAIEVWVKVGSRYEPLSLNGIAHFIEHMNFKGTSKRNAQKIAEEFDAIGGYLNAYTSKEHTVYSAKVLKEFLPLAIDMLADIMFNSIYDPEELEKEKNVVLQELAQTLDTPDETIFECFSSAAFAEQAVGRSILGDEGNILSFNQKKVKDFVSQHYIAPKIIISAGGNLDHQQLVDLVAEKFNPFPNQDLIESEKATYTGGSKLELDAELSQLHLIIGYEGVTLDSKDYYTLEMLASILGGSISSRLFQEIREKRGLVYSISSFCQYYLDAGVFGIYLSAESKKQQEIISLISEEIQKISQNITKEEIDRCLAQVKSSLYMSRETADNWVSILASNYSCYGRYISREEIWNGYLNVTIEKLHKLAKEIFTKEKTITLAALGEINHLPDYQQIHRSLTI